MTTPPPSGDAPPAPGFFLVGTGRCGSSLLRRTLNHHQHAYIPQETHWIPILHDHLGRTPITIDQFFTAISSVFMAKGRSAYRRIQNDTQLDAATIEAGVAQRCPGPADLVTFQTALYQTLAALHGKTLWGDKTPDYGLCMELLQSMWPKAKFVHIVRDGRDTALSMTRVLSFRYLVAWKCVYWPTIAWRKAYRAKQRKTRGELPLDDFFQLWRRRVERIRDEATRLAPGTFLELDYNQLLEDPEGTLKQVCEFVQLDVDADWLRTATAEYDPSNAAKNKTSKEYATLTREHGETLERLGFQV